VHNPPAGPVHPALHEHAVEAMLPRGESEFARQASHTAAPVSALYVPAAHCEHVPPLGPDEPASHWQLSSAVLAAGLLPELAGHVIQSPS